MQRMGRFLTPTLCREALVPAAHVVVGDERVHLAGGKLLQVRFAVIARIGCEQ
ncbi:MAG: hypothetical protein ABR543_03725 [Gemmatimonadaceae bacterium]